MFILSGTVVFVYVADRTGFWFKEQKQFDPWFFGSLSVLALLVGLVTVKRTDKDLGFLNREQTDEWKGWMQSESLYEFLWMTGELCMDCSRNFNLSLLWSFEDFRDLQPCPCPCLCVPLHDRLWPHCLLLKESGLWFPSCGTGENSAASNQSYAYLYPGYGQIELTHHRPCIRDEHRLPFLLLCAVGFILVYRRLRHDGVRFSV